MNLASKLASVDVGGLVIDGIVGLLGLTMVGVVIAGAVAAQGPRHCRDAIEENAAGRLPARVETGTMWARTLDDHWMAVLVFQPRDIEQDAFTVACHFQGKTFTIGSLESHDGDQRDKLKLISTNNMLPWVWF